MSEPVKDKRVRKRSYTSAIRQDQAARTRALIVNAAAELFTSDGYAQTTVRAIADRAGVAVDTVYAAFGTKVRVLTAVIDSRLAPPGTANVTDRPEATAVGTSPTSVARSTCSRTTSRPCRRACAPSTRSSARPPPWSPKCVVYAEMEQHRLANMRRVASWLAARGAWPSTGSGGTDDLGGGQSRRGPHAVRRGGLERAPARGVARGGARGHAAASRRAPPLLTPRSSGQHATERGVGRVVAAHAVHAGARGVDAEQMKIDGSGVL